MRLVVTPSTALVRGIVPGPLDPIAASFAVTVAALAKGEVSELVGRGLPRLRIVEALRSMGAEIAEIRDHRGASRGLRLRGMAFEDLRAPTTPLDAGDEVGAMVALAALASSLPFATTLVGDTSTMREFMAPIAKVLRRRGARIEGRIVTPAAHGARGRIGHIEPPFEVGPADVPLSPLSFDLAEVDGWPDAGVLVKAAAMLSGLDADGTTQLLERELSDDFFPGLLSAAGVSIRSLGPVTEFDGPTRLGPLSGELPVDATAAAAILALGLQPDSGLVGVRRVPTRTTSSGWLEALTAAGALLRAEPKSDSLGQAASDVLLQGPLRSGLEVGGERARRAGVRPAVLAAIGARCPEHATSRLFDMASLDGEIEELLRRFGVATRTTSDGLEIAGLGTRRVAAGAIDCKGRVDLALAALVLASGAEGPCALENHGELRDRYPRLLPTMRALGLTVDVAT